MAPSNHPHAPPTGIENRLATFDYMKWNPKFHTGEEKPFRILIPIPASAPDQRTTNVDFAPGPEEVVTDVRGREGEFSLDGHGVFYH
jgi:hypothetical protein